MVCVDVIALPPNLTTFFHCSMDGLPSLRLTYIHTYIPTYIQDWTPEVTRPVLLKRVILPTLAAAVIETLPINDWDNLTVFVTALGTDCWIAKQAGIEP